MRLTRPLIVSMLAAAGASTAHLRADTRTDPIAARMISRVAVVDLKLANNPGQEEFAAAAALLEHAKALDPTDEDILRLLIEACGAAGDQARVNELTVDLVRLRPSDTVAQLRLIAGRIGTLQTVESRLEAYRNFLGPRGESIDAAVRSRLALDCSLLLRERGDVVGFAGMLARAMELDSTNKDAATLALAFFDERSVPDPIARHDLLQMLLLADPIDENTHLAIAEHLSANGAFAGAARFFATYFSIQNRRGAQTSQDIVAAMQANRWCVDGAQGLIETTRREIDQARRNAERQRQAMLRDRPDLAPDKLPDPSALRLSIEMERVRLAAALGLGDPQEIDFASSEALVTGARWRDIAAQSMTTPEGGPAPDEARLRQAAARLRWIEAEVLWWRLWSGRELDQAAEMLARLSADPEASPDAIRSMEGWLALQRGDLARAEELFRLSPDETAAVGLAVLAERRGQAGEAAVMYNALAQRLAGTVAGAFARERHTRIVGAPPEQSAAARSLEAAARATPSWVESIANSPDRFISLQATAARTTLDPLDKAVLRLTIRNIAPVPMAIGPDRVIASRALLAPRAELGLREVTTSQALEVVNLDRRLRLQPREELVVDLWPDSGSLGWVLEQLNAGAARLRWRILQGFIMGQDGLFVAAPMSLSADTPILTRLASPKLGASPDDLVASIRSGSVLEMIESLMVARARVLRRSADPEPLTPAQERAIYEALIARWPSLDLAAKAMAMASTPTRPQAPESAMLDQIFTGETEPALIALAITMRVVDPGSPMLNPVRWRDNPGLAAVARSTKSQLAAEEPTYSRLVSPFGSSAAAAPTPGGAEAPRGAVP